MFGRQCVADEKAFSRLPKNSSDNQWQVFLSLTLHCEDSEPEVAKETGTRSAILPPHTDNGLRPHSLQGR